jgi:NTE family protein
VSHWIIADSRGTKPSWDIRFDVQNIPLPVRSSCTVLVGGWTYLDFQQGVNPIGFNIVIPPYIDGTDVLVDGGLLNNVPIDHMLQRTQGPIIGVNASPLRKLEYHENPSRNPSNSMFQKLRSRFQPDGNLSLFDILSEAMVVSSHRKVLATKDEIDLFLELPLSEFKMTQFEAIEEMMSLSYEYALPLLTELKNNHVELQYL